MQLTLPDEQATWDLGARLAGLLARLGSDAPFVVYLCGELGAGKTTLVRALLRASGVEGPVKSPTYTLVEPYRISGRNCYHIDLYRLGDAQELEFLGLEDWLAEHALLLVEWPEKGRGVLPAPQLTVYLEHAGQSGRRAELSAEHAGLLDIFS